MEISYYKTELLTLDRLTEFQGELKELTEDNFNRLWKSMQDNGFAEPFVVWDDLKTKKIYVLGGHQRLRVLKEKRKLNEKIPAKYPCNFVKCESRWHAKRLLGTLASQYGEVTSEGLYQFATENNFDEIFLKENFSFQNIDFDRFFESILPPEDAYENLPDIDIQGDVENRGDYIIVRFDTEAIGNEIRAKIGLKEGNRVIEWNKLSEVCEIKTINEEQE